MSAEVLREKDNGSSWDMSMLTVLFIRCIYLSLEEGKAGWYAWLYTTKVKLKHRCQRLQKKKGVGKGVIFELK